MNVQLTGSAVWEGLFAPVLEFVDISQASQHYYANVVVSKALAATVRHPPLPWHHPEALPLR